MKQEIFTFNGVEYYSVNAVRTAISKQTKVCFGVPQTAKEWKKLGVTYTIVAHSERRQIMKETDADFIQKIELLLQTNIRPIFCIGETETEREQGKTNDVLSSQIEDVFSSFDTSNLQSIILAYEPVWAIGTGKVARILKRQYPISKSLFLLIIMSIYQFYMVEVSILLILLLWK